MTAKHTYVNERVALLYGIESVKGEWFQRVELDDSTRWGLLGKGAILMAAAYPNRTSPVLRGAFILEHITGTPPAAPPPNVEALPEDEGTPATVARTVREKMAAHSDEPDVLLVPRHPRSARLRARELRRGRHLARARSLRRRRARHLGRLARRHASLHGPDDLREALLRRPDQFVQTFTERLLTYALGRTFDYEDMPTVRKIVRDAASDDYRFSSIVWAIVESERFQIETVPRSRRTKRCRRK